MKPCRVDKMRSRKPFGVVYAIVLLLSAPGLHGAQSTGPRPAESADPGLSHSAIAGPTEFDAPLADAAERLDRAAVRALLKEGVGVDAAQVDGMTALHWAAYHDDREMSELLLGAGGDVRAANRYGVTPLSLACTNGNGEIVELLLKAGADPNWPLPGGETPLMTAARTGRLEPVKALLARGAAVDAGDAYRGQTALMWAAAEGHADVVRALIGAGANLGARLPSGFTPLLFAVREGRLGVVHALLEAGADANDTVPVASGRGRGYGGRLPAAGTSALLLAVMNAHFELAAHLLDAGANPNADLTGYTTLHAVTAVRKPGVGDNDPAPQGSGTMSSLDLVKKLVARGANVNARMTRRANLNNTRLNELGATPFLLAALTSDAELMRTLAALGADPLLPNADNSTPLMMAAGLATRSPGEDAGTEAEVLEAVQVALELGADINAVDNNGETAVHGAAYKNLPEVVKFFASKGARIEVWNRDNRFGWTPLAIATGYRFGNFKPSPETEAAVREEMIAAGVTPPKTVVARTQQIY
ncbi:MAG: ankyrin repeat domain-containing protein [Vicinamibacterales bacterium]